MQITFSALVLSLASVALSTPLVVKRQSSQAQVVIDALDVIGKDAAHYKAVIDKYPVYGSDAQQTAALKAISDAGKQIASDWNAQPLWNVLNSDFHFTAADEQLIADKLSKDVVPNYQGASTDLQQLEPSIKKLGCYDALNSVHTDLEALADATWHATNYIAVYRTSSGGTGPITAPNTAIANALTGAVSKYQVGPYTGIGDEPTDNCGRS